MRLLIAGGGTGGHLFPALAIAEALRELDPQGTVLFVGTSHGIETSVIPKVGLELRLITARGMRKTGFWNKMWAILEIPIGMWESFKIIREFRPTFVLGVGGFASGPTLASAVIMRVPTAIQEQNCVMGTTNRLLSAFVDRIFTSWESTDPVPPKKKTHVVGNPIRRDVLRGDPWERAPSKFNVLVFGGSRGARSINVALTDNLETLKPFGDRIRIVHQTGQGQVDDVKRAYDAAGIEAEVRDFIEDMGPAYKWADLVVSRSGASSLAEIAALGKAAIVVPYPYAIGDHQTRNARVLESAGALTIVPDQSLKNGALVNEILQFMEHAEKLAEMSAKSAKYGRPDAAYTIAREILTMERQLL